MIALIGFIVGAIYFGYKAFSLKENWGLYAVVGGIATGVFSFIIATVVFFGMMFLGIEIRGGGVDIVGIPILAVSLYLVDKWSGLYWNSEQHAAEKEKKNDNLSGDELATIRSLQIQKGEGSLEELQAYESALSVENSEADNEVEKLELTQNSLPGEVDYIVIPDTIKKHFPKMKKG